MARKSRVLQQENIPFAASAVHWRIAVYLRLSVEDGDDIESNSIGNQKKICIQYVSEQENMEIVEFYTDHGFSGMTYKRPGFQQMYADLLQGKINCILVKDTSRFGRNYITTSEYLQKIFPAMGIRFIAINDEYDSLFPNADVEGLLLPFKMILNDSYAKDTSKKIRSSITAKMNNGEYLPSMGSVPYGYQRDPENNTYTVDVEPAGVVNRIFAMRAQGMKFNAIARKLNEESIPSPGRLRFLRGISTDKRFEGSLWIRGTIRKIVTDQAYTGKRIHGKIKRDHLGDDKTKRSQEDWLIIPNAHPAIVSETLFDTVQQVNRAEIEKMSKYITHDPPKDDFRDALRDKLYCGDCGTRMIAMKRNQRLTSDLPAEIFYQCNKYKYSDNKECGNHYISQRSIISVLKRVIDKQLAVAFDFDESRKKAAAISQTRCAAPTPSDSLQSIRIRRKNVDAKLERLLLDLTDGILTRSEYEHLHTEYQSERYMLLKSEEEAECREQKEREREAATKEWMAALAKYREISVVDEKVIKLLVDRISVFADGTIDVTLNFHNPYLFVKEVLSNAG